MKSSGWYAYILAIGKSNANHLKVIDHYLEKADTLMKGIECFFELPRKLSVLLWGYSAGAQTGQSSSPLLILEKMGITGGLQEGLSMSCKSFFLRATAATNP